MRKYQKCQWTKIGTTMLCNKDCFYEYCKVHAFHIRKGYTAPRPCRSCGIGTNAETLLCRNCGNELAQMRIVAKEKRARKLFKRVLVELLNHSHAKVDYNQANAYFIDAVAPATTTGAAAASHSIFIFNFFIYI